MLKNMDFTQIDKILRPVLDEKRYIHSMSVAYTAEMLSKKFSLNRDVCFYAGMLHDIARQYPKEEIDRIVEDRKIELEPEEKENWVLQHAPVGARLVYDMGLQELYVPIRFHTLGSRTMGKEGAAVYIADYIEPGRTHLSDMEKQIIFMLPTLEDMVMYIISRSRTYFKAKGHTEAKITTELYTWLEEGNRFEDTDLSVSDISFSNVVHTR